MNDTDRDRPKQDVPNSIFNDQERLLQYYNIQMEDFRMRHTAIWTEVKHYTWVLSIILGAGPVAVLGKENLESYNGLLFMLPVIGLIVAVIAFKIIKNDFIYFTLADSRLLYLEKMLGVVHEKDYTDNRLKRALVEDFSVSNDATQESKIDFIPRRNPRIRVLILSTFLLYAIASIFEIVYFYFLFICV